MPRLLSRRALLQAVAVIGLTSCGDALRGRGELPRADDLRLRLTARPDPATPRSLAVGTSPLRLGNGREGLLHVPIKDARGLVVALHGAGGNARLGLDLVRKQADRLGFVVLAPASAGSTWGVIRGGADPDTPALGTALSHVLARQPVDPRRLAVAGFSDGGSYALTLGLANGDLFRRVVAFSPGFEAADQRRGQPEFFITHGRRDKVLPIQRTSRRVVRALRRDGYVVIYREFNGRHVVPGALATEAMEWILR